MAICNQCHAEAERIRRARKRAQLEHKKMGKCLTELRRARSNRQLAQLCAMMLEQYGGLDGFAAAFARYQQRVTKQGGPASLRCMQTVLRIMQYLDETRPDLSEMSDDDLRVSLERHVTELIRQQPALAIDAADRLGWIVMPPTETPSHA